MEIHSGSTDCKWNLSLIQTKMMTPRLPSGCVQRLALPERFRERGACSVTVVTAPAGFGKTTMLAGWSEALSRHGHPVAWLSLDEEDDDPQQFGAYLVGAFARASESIASQAQRLLNNDALTPIRTVISVLLNGIAAYGQNVFLVLDDADRLTAKPVLAVVSRLLRYAPDNMHVLLGARGEPQLALGQLKVPEKLMRIGVDDLRFSIDDAQAFFDQTSTVSLDRPSVELLNDATEGWVAGLQLASLALSRAGDAAKVASNFAGTSSGIDRYLDDTVLAHLPPPMLKFLLYTSILERLSQAVCDALMEDAGESGEKLHWLERHNVFIRPLDEKQDWYRYHALMSDALRRRLIRQMPRDVPVLHRRAYQWFAQEGLWPEAVRHALAAGELELAAQWVENCALELLERGEPHTLLGWVGKLPPDAIKKRLRLRIAKAWALAFVLEPVQAAKEIREIVEEVNRPRRDDDKVIEAAIVSEVTVVNAVIAGITDDSERALALGYAAEVSMASASPWARRLAQTVQFFGLMYRGDFAPIRRMWAVVESRAGQGPERIYSDMMRHASYGLAAMVYGELEEGRQAFEGTLQRAEIAIGRSSAGVSGLAGCLASICYECNELQRAQELVAGRTALALESSPLGALIRHTLCASRLLWRGGETGSALAMLEDGRQVAVKREWLRLQLACDAETVKLFLFEGNLAQARQLADELSASVPAQCEGRMGSAVETWTSYCLLQARVLIAENFADKAVILLERSLATVTNLGWRCHEAHLSLLLSIGFEQCGASDKAFAALEHALHIGKAIGLVNSFVDEGPSARALLQRFRQFLGEGSTAETTYIDRLLAAFDDARIFSIAAPLAAEAVTVSSSDLLSVRELEVLNHVARGLSNKEIGRSLELTPETVKWHLKNIFEKLNVSSRIEAVQSVLGIGTQGGGIVA